MELFEKATKLKLRFVTPKGSVSAEDLWDLPLSSPRAGNPNLDAIAITLNRFLKDTSQESFVTETKPSDTIAKLKFDIVLHIIGVKKAENVAAATLKANKDKKQQLLSLVADKENEELKGKSLEELTNMIKSLG